MKNEEKNKGTEKMVQEGMIPDFTNVDEVRKAFIMSEILNKKY
ncbi:MAG: hypothetical protein ACI4BD_07650 [Paludibacteraceae bacterium]